MPYNLSNYVLFGLTNFSDLKKLDLGILSARGSLTDAVFIHVFRHLRIKEFRMRTWEPFVSVRIHLHLN